MDFIARAGSILERSQRLSGILLLILIVQTFYVLHVVDRNAELNRLYDRLRATTEVYVVPGSLPGTYAPTHERMLLEAFITLFTQSMHTYTYKNIEQRLNEVEKFISPELLVFTEDAFDQLVETAVREQRSSLFVPDKESLEVKDEQANGKIKNVKIKGEKHYIISGSLVEAVPITIEMKVRKVAISKSNPFGFMLVEYKEQEEG